MRGHSGEKIAHESRNSCRVNGRSCGCTRTADTERNLAQSQNQIETLKECLLCHIYCAKLQPHVATIDTASCTVSNRESLYPRAIQQRQERNGRSEEMGVPPISFQIILTLAGHWSGGTQVLIVNGLKRSYKLIGSLPVLCHGIQSQWGVKEGGGVGAGEDHLQTSGKASTLFSRRL